MQSNVNHTDINHIMDKITYDNFFNIDESYKLSIMGSSFMLATL